MLFFSVILQSLSFSNYPVKHIVLFSLEIFIHVLGVVNGYFSGYCRNGGLKRGDQLLSVNGVVRILILLACNVGIQLKISSPKNKQQQSLLVMIFV